MARLIPVANTQSAHYSLLAEYHATAARAAGKLEDALKRKEQAEEQIREARRDLASTQNLINNWYSEPQPEEPAA